MEATAAAAGADEAQSDAGEGIEVGVDVPPTDENASLPLPLLPLLLMVPPLPMLLIPPLLPPAPGVVPREVEEEEEAAALQSSIWPSSWRRAATI